MLNRTVILTFALTALGTSAIAAIPDGTQPSDKPALNRASPMINDPLTGTPIRGKAPTAKPVAPPNQNLQAVLPDKPVLYRASPMIDDPLGVRLHAAPPTPQPK